MQDELKRSYKLDARALLSLDAPASKLYQHISVILQGFIRLCRLPRKLICPPILSQLSIYDAYIVRRFRPLLFRWFVSATVHLGLQKGHELVAI